MTFKTRKIKNRTGAFTLAEVLAALMFMAIVIPVVVQAINTASLAGEVAVRKGSATRVADRILNENIINTNRVQSSQSGTTIEGAMDFNWTFKTEKWPTDTMDLLTVEVKFQAQGKDYSVKLSTLTAQPQNLLTGVAQ